MSSEFIASAAALFHWQPALPARCVPPSVITPRRKNRRTPCDRRHHRRRRAGPAARRGSRREAKAISSDRRQGGAGTEHRRLSRSDAVRHGAGPSSIPIDGALYEAMAARLRRQNCCRRSSAGASRQESVLAGLDALAPHAPALVLIHDAARPFVTASVIGRVLDSSGRQCGRACRPARFGYAESRRGRPRRQTISREGLWRAQTPQGFHFAAHSSSASGRGGRGPRGFHRRCRRSPNGAGLGRAGDGLGAQRQADHAGGFRTG